MPRITFDKDNGKAVLESECRLYCDGCGRTVGRTENAPYLEVGMSVWADWRHQSPTEVGLCKGISERAILANDPTPRFEDFERDGHWSQQSALLLCLACAEERKLCRVAKPEAP